MCYALILALVSQLQATTEHDPVEVLKRVTRQVLASTAHIPNYSCVQTVTREHFAPAAATLPRACAVLLEQRRHPTLDMMLRSFSTDRLRLDVTLVGSGEIFSWVGASKFVDADIDRLVRNGPMGTGAFGGFLIAVFQADVKKFTFERNVVVDSRSLLEYSFEVKKSESHYKTRLDNSWYYTAYSGTFQVDPETDDLVRMTVQTMDLPPAIGECQSTVTMEFGRVRIGDTEFLLPKLAHQRFLSPTGAEVENTTVFANCREYRGESTITFQESEPLARNPAGSGPAKPLSVPAGLRLAFELTTPVSSETAAAGDPFVGRLVQAMRDGRQKVVAPKGAIVEGHFLRVESFRRPPEVVIAFRPDVLVINGSRVLLTAVRDWGPELAEKKSKAWRGVEVIVPLPGEDNSGVFRFPGEPVVVPSGFRSDWRTVTPRDTAQTSR